MGAIVANAPRRPARRPRARRGGDSGRTMPAPVPELPLDPVCAPPLDMARIRAISIDLDDTLWPIRPTIARAEAALLDCLGQHAPATAAALADGQALRALGRPVLALGPGLQKNVSGLPPAALSLVL